MPTVIFGVLKKRYLQPTKIQVFFLSFFFFSVIYFGEFHASEIQKFLRLTTFRQVMIYSKLWGKNSMEKILASCCQHVNGIRFEESTMTKYKTVGPRGRAGGHPLPLRPSRFWPVCTLSAKDRGATKNPAVDLELILMHHFSRILRLDFSSVLSTALNSLVAQNMVDQKC